MFFQLLIFGDYLTFGSGQLCVWISGFFGIWKFLGFLDFNNNQSFPEHVGNVLLALYIGFGGYLTFGSGQLCFPLWLPQILQVSKPFSILPIFVPQPEKKEKSK